MWAISISLDRKKTICLLFPLFSFPKGSKSGQAIASFVHFRQKHVKDGTTARRNESKTVKDFMKQSCPTTDLWEKEIKPNLICQCIWEGDSLCSSRSALIILTNTLPFTVMLSMIFWRQFEVSHHQILREGDESGPSRYLWMQQLQSKPQRTNPIVTTQ